MPLFFLMRTIEVGNSSTRMQTSGRDGLCHTPASERSFRSLLPSAVRNLENARSRVFTLMFPRKRQQASALHATSVPHEGRDRAAQDSTALHVVTSEGTRQHDVQSYYGGDDEKCSRLLGWTGWACICLFS